jgi:RNA polymerase sigma-70 factor (ECF subfamily)
MSIENKTDVAALFLAHQARIYGFISSLVLNRADAEDLLQETGLVIFSRAGDYQPGTNFMAWACQIAHNKVLNHRTRQSRSPLRFGDAFISALAEYQLGRLDDNADQHAALARCLEKLPARDHALVQQCYYAGTTIKQVAIKLDRPPNVIYKRLKQIREQLRNCIQEEATASGGSP